MDPIEKLPHESILLLYCIQCAPPSDQAGESLHFEDFIFNLNWMGNKNCGNKCHWNSCWNQLQVPYIIVKSHVSLMKRDSFSDWRKDFEMHLTNELGVKVQLDFLF